VQIPSDPFNPRNPRLLSDLAFVLADVSYELGGHFSLKAKARTSQGQLPELTRWQAPGRETRSAVAVQDHY
jgi:hypothetical protein